MNIAVLLANILTLLACVVHTFVGDKELRTLQPAADAESKKRATWTMSRCGWHWISFDLLCASIALALVNHTSVIHDKQLLLTVIAVYFTGYSIVWLGTIVLSPPFEKRFLQLGQWILLLAIGILSYVGTL